MLSALRDSRHIKLLLGRRRAQVIISQNCQMITLHNVQPQWSTFVNYSKGVIFAYLIDTVTPP